MALCHFSVCERCVGLSLVHMVKPAEPGWSGCVFSGNLAGSQGCHSTDIVNPPLVSGNCLAQKWKQRQECNGKCTSYIWFCSKLYLEHECTFPVYIYIYIYCIPAVSGNIRTCNECHPRLGGWTVYSSSPEINGYINLYAPCILYIGQVYRYSPE